MTRSALRRTAAGLVAACVLAFAPATASAGVELGFLKHWFGPPPLWEGRVSGNSESTYYEHEMAVSLVGCFPTLEECTLWRMRMTGSMQGRIIYNECRPR